MNPVIGIDLGGTRIKCVVFSDKGELLSKQTQDFDSNQALDWCRCIESITQKILSEFEIKDVRIGLSAPGLVAKNQRSISHMPGRLQGLEGLDWTELLNSQYPVKVINDAQAALMGEVWQGVAKGMTNVIMITLGTGVGGAAMVDGHLLKGHLGRAGHLGYGQRAQLGHVLGVPPIAGEVLVERHANAHGAHARVALGSAVDC